MHTVLVLLAALASGDAPAQRLLAIDPAHSTLSYGVVHKLHKVRGESRSMEGKVALLPDGRVQLMVRAPVASFKSGDANRDEHMQEVLEVGKYAYVVFKAALKLTPPPSFPATQEVTVPGELEFHGRKKAESIPLRLDWASEREVRVKGSFDVSLDAYQVERPSLLFVKIEDACAIGVDLVLGEEGK